MGLVNESLMVRFIARMELTYRASKPLTHKMDAFEVDVARSEVSRLEVLLNLFLIYHNLFSFDLRLS